MEYIEVEINEKKYMIPKGNFGFVQKAASKGKNEEYGKKIFKSLLLAEKQLLVDYELFAIFLRRAFETIAIYEEAKWRFQNNNGKGNISAYIKKVEDDYRSPDFSLKGCLIDICKDDQRFKTFANDFCKKLRHPDGYGIISYIKYVYSFCSENLHAGNVYEEDYIANRENCLKLAKSFHKFLKILYKCPNAPDFDEKLIPIDDYYSLYKDTGNHIITPDIWLKDNNKIYVKDSFGGPNFYIISFNDKAGDKPSRSLRTLYKLNEKNYKNPGNIISYREILTNQQGDDFSCAVYRLPGFPYELTEEYLSDLEASDKRDIVRGVCNAVFSLHTYSQPLYHRNINPRSIVVTEIEGKFVPVLFEFNIVKDESEEWTVISDVERQYNKKKNKRYVAPEVKNSSKEDRKTWGKEWEKVDIYSLGKTILFILSNSHSVIQIDDRDKLYKEIDRVLKKNGYDNAASEMLKKMIDDDPGVRPGIEEVMNCFK